LLKHALGGNCHTLMVACISPCDAHAEENASTLAYSTRARAIANTPVVNVDPHAAQVAALKTEIRSLKAEMQRLQQLLALSPTELSLLPVETPAVLPAPCAMVTEPNASTFADDLLVHGTHGWGAGAGAAKVALDGGRGVHGVAQQGVIETTEFSASVVGTSASPIGKAKHSESSAELGEGLVQGVQLAKQLAKSNAQLRNAFDSVVEQRDELERANAQLMGENSEVREKLTFFELALSMESYPSAPPASLAAQIEQQAASRPNPDPAAALVAYGSSQRWASIDCRMCVITLHSAPVPL